MILPASSSIRTQRLPAIPSIQALARKAGDPGQLETCDIIEAYGQISLFPETMVSFFQREDGTPKPPEEIAGKVLPFFRQCPSITEFSRRLGEIVLKAESKDKEKMGDPFAEFLGVLDWYYGGLKRAHEQSGLPYAAEELTPLLSYLIAAIGSGNADFGMQAIRWACAKQNLPDVFFATLSQGLIEGSLQSDPSARGATEVACYETATAARKGEMDLFRQESRRTQYGLLPGDVLPMESLRARAAQQIVTVIYLWHPACPACRDAAAVVNALHQKLGAMRLGSVVGIRPDSEDAATYDTAAKGWGAPWQTTAIPLHDAQLLSPRGTVPHFIIVDRTGKIVGVVEGYDEDLQQRLEDAIEDIAPTIHSIPL